MSLQPPAPPPSDWATQVADTIDHFVGLVRDKTTQPVVTVTRAIVFGLLAVILGIAALVLVAITFVRVLTFLPGGVWVAHLITGLLFLLVGIIAMVKRHPPAEAA
jgi:vacuolar-type H+-ATPase subunit I/STV1